ncbi:MAG TPA: 30S ribosomal protein S8 [Candidatus Saccharimonadales bacterium]|nr:30S ribosomal protein S8 [Candidatus Saccharimonadales bacterium]
MSMLSTDPIADMLTRIRNAIMVNKREVRLPHSTMKERVARELVNAGFLAKVEVKETKPQSEMIITINREGQNPVITAIERVSKPGRRLYAKASELPRIKSGRGVVIVSTSKGVMTGQAATKAKLGGELICKVY